MKLCPVRTSHGTHEPRLGSKRKLTFLLLPSGVTLGKPPHPRLYLLWEKGTGPLPKSYKN